MPALTTVVGTASTCRTPTVAIAIAIEAGPSRICANSTRPLLRSDDDTMRISAMGMTPKVTARSTSPPRVASACPSSEVPVPKAMTGTRCAAQSRTTA